MDGQKDRQNNERTDGRTEGRKNERTNKRMNAGRQEKQRLKLAHHLSHLYVQFSLMQKPSLSFSAFPQPWLWFYVYKMMLNPGKVERNIRLEKRNI